MAEVAKPIVIYDGECGICGGNLHWLNRLDLFRRFVALPYQSEEVYRLCPQVKRVDCEVSLHLVLPDGRVFRGSDAFREIFLRMPLTAPLALIMAIPPLPSILRKLYPLLSENRYRLGGHCRLPPAGEANSPDAAGRK